MANILCQFPSSQNKVTSVYRQSGVSVNSFYGAGATKATRKTTIGFSIPDLNKVKFCQTLPSFSKRVGSTITPKDRSIRYELSNKKFIDYGWTNVKFRYMQKIQVYGTKPARCGDWLKTVRPLNCSTYDAGTVFIERKISDITTFYRSENMALRFTPKDKRYNGEDIYKVFSDDKQPKILALFDVVGNGIVYDEHEEIRFVYNQHEIEIVDPRIGRPGRIGWRGNRLTRVVREMYTGQKLLDPDPVLDSLIESIISYTPNTVATSKGVPRAASKVIGPPSTAKSVPRTASKVFSLGASPNSSASKMPISKSAAKSLKSLGSQHESINDKILLEETVPEDSWKRPVSVGMKAHHVQINSNFALVMSRPDSITLKFWDKRHTFKIQLGFIVDRTQSNSLYVDPDIVTCSFNGSPPANRGYYELGQLLVRKRKEYVKKDVRSKRLRGIRDDPQA